MKLLYKIAGIICLAAVLLFFLYRKGLFSSPAPAVSESGNVHKKKKGAGPRYWIAYEYCWVNDKPIPEMEWKANVDWVTANFKDYGYDMVSNDGWIESAQTINTDGYITKYNDAWVNGFAYWANYLAEKGMKMGIYYNPMWLTKAAFEQNVLVKGTSYHARDIVGAHSFNEPLYWVDVAKPGAKEWIQQYVQYFRSMGVNYLRIDFLENYERNYGTEKYALALQWIQEAATDSMLLSLVMPNCYNHGKTELVYGDMIRIDDDCFKGGWDFISDRRRGERKENWPQYGNAFDGFIGFADIGGRDQMILDGDFIRLNTLPDDKERKFQVSLFTIAGSPICIADQYNSIGNSAWVYQNKELLDLNDQGFIGKPLSYDVNDVVNSSRWVGQLPDGDWIVGLFNRENTPQNRSIDLEKELGLTNGTTGNARDLWAHTDMGKLSGIYTTNLEAHECRMLKIKNNEERKYEAEVASMIGGAKKSMDKLHYSGPGYVTKFDTIGAKVFFAVSVPAKGDYRLNARYANSIGKAGTASVYINDARLDGQLSMPPLSGRDTWGIADKTVTLNAGVNYLAIQYDAGDNGLFDLDYIQIEPSGMAK